MIVNLEQYFNICTFRLQEDSAIEKIIVPFTLENLYLIELVKKLKSNDCSLEIESICSSDEVYRILQTEKNLFHKIEKLKAGQVRRRIKATTTVSVHQVEKIMLHTIEKQVSQISSELHTILLMAKCSNLLGVCNMFNVSNLSTKEFIQFTQKYIKEHEQQR